jgi:hypothetical protein
MAATRQGEKGDAYMFFQISIDKNGVVTAHLKPVEWREIADLRPSRQGNRAGSLENRIK